MSKQDQIGTMKSDPFIYIKDNDLSAEFCQHIIDKFEKQTPERGVVGYDKRVEEKLKKTYDLWLYNDIENWQEEDNQFFNHLTDNLDRYTDHIKTIHPALGYQSPDDIVKDTGYQIQKYSKDERGHYNWHNDFMFSDRLGPRMLTYIWYLNDVKEGGHTEFVNGSKVKPKQGRICIFPSTWNYLHRGCVPISNDKYIVTGWLYCKPQSVSFSYN